MLLIVLSMEFKNGISTLCSRGGNGAEVAFEEASGVLRKALVWNVKHHSGFKTEGLTLQPLPTCIPSMTPHESKLESQLLFAQSSFLRS